MKHASIPKPPVLSTDAPTATVQIRRYLWQLADQLQSVLDSIPETEEKTEDTTQDAPEYLRRKLGRKHAGSLLYIDEDGLIKPLQVGEGLVIEDGTIRGG